MKPLAALVRETWYGLTINGLVASVVVPRQLRWLALRVFGVHIGRSVVAPRVFFGRPTRISIGSGTFINYGAFLDGSGGITIGDSVSFGPEVMVITASHDTGPVTKRAGRDTTAPVVIGDGTWIGARVTILPGVKIGEGCVIAAGAVVIGDCEPGATYGGVPARLLTP